MPTKIADRKLAGRCNYRWVCDVCGKNKRTGWLGSPKGWVAATFHKGAGMKDTFKEHEFCSTVCLLRFLEPDHA